MEKWIAAEGGRSLCNRKPLSRSSCESTRRRLRAKKGLRPITWAKERAWWCPVDGNHENMNMVVILRMQDRKNVPRGLLGLLAHELSTALRNPQKGHTAQAITKPQGQCLLKSVLYRSLTFTVFSSNLGSCPPSSKKKASLCSTHAAPGPKTPTLQIHPSF